MIRCLKCGTTLAPHARFCSVCGAEVLAASPNNAVGNTTQSFDRTQGVAAQPGQQNPNLTQNINRTQGFSRTAAFQSGEMQATTAINTQGGYGPGGPTPGGEDKKRLAITIGAGVALLVIAGLVFLSASGLLAANKPTGSTGAVLSAPPTQIAQAPVLVAPAPQQNTAPVVAAPASKETPMPQEVIDYLRWLKEFEKGRLALESKSEAQLLLVVQELVKVGMVGTPGMGLLDGDSDAPKDKSASPAIDLKSVNGVIQDWNTAAGIFQQKPPPDSCATLATNYGNGLNGSVTAMTQVLGSGVKAIESINAAGGEKTSDATDVLSFLKDQHNNGGLSQGIEQSFGQANDSLDAIRSQYVNIPSDIDKGAFTIKSGGSSGPNIPIPGLGM